MQGEAALISDLRANLYMTQAEAEAAYAEAPEWLRELCRAFADGLNFYLATHPEVQPQRLTRFEPWMPFYFFEGSIGGEIEQVPLAGIADFYARGRAVEAELPSAKDRNSKGTFRAVSQSERRKRCQLRTQSAETSHIIDHRLEPPSPV